MKIPKAPPDFLTIFHELARESPEALTKVVDASIKHGRQLDEYLPWDKVRYRKAPDGLTHTEWWLAIKLARNAAVRPLPLLDKHGQEFTYTLPDQVLRAIDDVTRTASGNISISEQVTNPATRDRYLVSSLIEEAITSSQLEGAATTRKVAKDMLRTGRSPRNRDERMIYNNYLAMRRISEMRDQALTPEIICELHRIVTDGTLDNPDAAGRLQLTTEERVGVYDTDNNLLHQPPPAHELPTRIQRLCDFANNEAPEKAYLPPVLRAINVHFMLSYDHPFEDGNGRTARALFYWSMLHQGFWLTEFLSISKILRGAPAKYARSFIYTEQDGNDLTYFHIYQLLVLQRAIRELHDYLARKMREVREFQRSLALIPGQFNHRQLALLENAVKDTTSRYTAISHAASHNVTVETARQDLLALQEKGLLTRMKIGRGHAWVPAANIADRLRDM